MTDKIAIHWFRQDLRLSDNPALFQAAQHGQVLPIFIWDTVNAGEHQMGEASRVWLHHSLISLNESLAGHLKLFKGDPIAVLQRLIDEHDISGVFYNRCYEPWRIQRDKRIKEELGKAGVQVESFNGSLLWEPWQVLKNDNTPYKVFTPFYRKGCLNVASPRIPLKKPNNLQLYSEIQSECTMNDLHLLPHIHWHQKMMQDWQVGEAAAQKQLTCFLEKNMSHYKEGRNFPALNSVSRLSPHLHFGEISPNQVWHAAKAKKDDDNVDHFCSELGWREFSYSLLYYNPMLPKQNLQQKFDHFPWHEDTNLLKAWQQGQTGIPIVDAGMRELWQTGYMHNRVRMIVGSFLVKNLLLHWHHGERWFWDCLVDADLANNSASWQWVAGCGADAAPFFRIFNPVMQGQKFDPNGEYTCQYVPELKHLPQKYLFNPWEAPAHILSQAGIKLGQDYPKPIVDLKFSREAALFAFQGLKEFRHIG